MKLGKIKGTQTFGENRVFNGTYITAEFVDTKGYLSTVSFHYAYSTNDLAGKVMSVLSSIANNKPVSKDISNVKVG